MTDRGAAPIVLTLGDPAGVGPEIAVAAWKSVGGKSAFVAMGDAGTLERAAGSVPVRRIDRIEMAVPDMLCVLDVPAPIAPVPGKPEPGNAASVVRSIEMAVDLVRTGRACALVTNPISKEVLIRGAGFAYPGHTEFLAALDGATLPVMMLASPKLRVVPVTIHCALAEVPAKLTPALIADTIRITDAALKRDFAIPAPRIAVAGLNPHAGENGLMGLEDGAVIAPVLEALRAEGLLLDGPKSADTMFHDRARAGYDCAVCMYHDQALIPIKTLDFDGGVNVTLGLSFVRTSPDHGTAFDIAGQGIARPDSLIAALRLANTLAGHRRS